MVLCVLSTRHYLSFYVSEANDFWARSSSDVGWQPWLALFKAKVTSCTKESDEWGQVTCSDSGLPESNVTCFCPPWANSLDSFTICALLHSLSFLSLSVHVKKLSKRHHKIQMTLSEFWIQVCWLGGCVRFYFLLMGHGNFFYLNFTLDMCLNPSLENWENTDVTSGLWDVY